MQQYFVKGLASSPVTIEDKETSKHMFQVMRLKEDDEVTLVFDDGIKRLARVVNVEARKLELIEELADNVELPVQVTIASGFPKGDKLEFITQKVTELGASQIWAFPADWSVAKWDGKASEIWSQALPFLRKRQTFWLSSTSLTGSWWPMKSQLKKARRPL